MNLLRGFREPALVPCGGVAVNQSLASGAIEQADGATTSLVRGLWIGRLLEGGAKRRALRAVAHRGGARLPHVFLGGLDIRHDEITPERRLVRLRFRRRKARPRNHGCQGAT